ncbi:hypothetical protein F2Q69_00039498 [Brassica cretica]|uniref:S-acyltransferase n=1 Tax=Brassica cretica TaxID=69181 RepID=A0A8S9ND78_BRACR|nr:hypothetical protein F2Q69_00039498 [Brassica cretica]
MVGHFKKGKLLCLFDLSHFDLPSTSGKLHSEWWQLLDSSQRSSLLHLLCSPCAMLCGCCSGRGESSEQQMSEDEMFYCSLCEVEVFKYNKHCKVCGKCVDSFDHHCRWINN